MPRRACYCLFSLLILTVLTGSTNASVTPNVITYLGNDFAINSLDTMAATYQKSTGVTIKIERTTLIDDTVLRAYTLKEPIDLVIIPYMKVLDYRERGWVTDLSEMVAIPYGFSYE